MGLFLNFRQFLLRCILHHRAVELLASNKCIQNDIYLYEKSRNGRTVHFYSLTCMQQRHETKGREQKANDFFLSPQNGVQFLFHLLSLLSFLVVIMVGHFHHHQNLVCCKIPFGLVGKEDDGNSWIKLTILSNDFYKQKVLEKVILTQH